MNVTIVPISWSRESQTLLSWLIGWWQDDITSHKVKLIWIHINSSIWSFPFYAKFCRFSLFLSLLQFRIILCFSVLKPSPPLPPLCLFLFLPCLVTYIHILEVHRGLKNCFGEGFQNTTQFSCRSTVILLIQTTDIEQTPLCDYLIQ